MIENISKKQENVQEKVQKKIQKQQELNDKDCRELTDEELEQIVGGAVTVPGAPGRTEPPDRFVLVKKGANGESYVDVALTHF